jgi:hypothetical protein
MITVLLHNGPDALTPAQAERYRPLFNNTKRLHELTSELQALSAEVVERAEGWARS